MSEKKKEVSVKHDIEELVIIKSFIEKTPGTIAIPAMRNLLDKCVDNINKLNETEEK